MTEAEMRDAEVLTSKTPKELSAYIAEPAQNKLEAARNHNKRAAAWMPLPTPPETNEGEAM
jgi:hypothetical protein